jgi:hypothetical protein
MKMAYDKSVLDAAEAKGSHDLALSASQVYVRGGGGVLLAPEMLCFASTKRFEAVSFGLGLSITLLLPQEGCLSEFF